MRARNLIFIFLLLFNVSMSQSRKIFGLNFNYVLSAFVYPNVISNDRGLRDFSNEVNGWIGFSGDVRYEITEGYFIGFSGEIVNKKISDFLTYKISNQIIKIPVEDRFTIYIAELSVFFVAPFSSEKFNLYIGGGIGAYKGRFKKIISNAESDIKKSPINLGIQVMSGVQYNFTGNLGLRAEIRFRDPVVEVESKFENNQINYNGYIISIDRSPFRTRVNFDTMTLMLGVALSF